VIVQIRLFGSVAIWSLALLGVCAVSAPSAWTRRSW
jgi:hypothetical protein